MGEWKREDDEGRKRWGADDGIGRMCVGRMGSCGDLIREGECARCVERWRRREV